MNHSMNCRFAAALVVLLGSAPLVSFGEGNDKALDKDKNKATELELADGVKMKFVRIEAGDFPKGSDTKLKVERIAKGFYLGESEVTQAQWKAVIGTTPWKSEKNVKEGGAYPATKVTWDDAQTFAQKVSNISKRKVRLPTEVEWEYACRAGTKTAYSFGNSDRELGDHAWWGGNTKGEEYAHEVKTKKPNPWGLYDMHGNAYEWCEDQYFPGTRVIRGGSWVVPVSPWCTSAIRSGIVPGDDRTDIGFRVLMDFAE